ncbi:MAG: hypothetical protein EKK63_04990 [Acinetobacter sp.]|nr:MAG: hypothetical protein EKK63_04990 [Acinetobacter sp.]
MALATVLDLVKVRLPFLPVGSSMDTTIETFKTERYYYLNKWTKIDIADIEDDSKYDGVLRFLVVRLVCYDLINRKVLENVGGTNGNAPTANKRLKKGKADVVEAEFDYAKASDGTTLSIDTVTLLSNLKSEICQYASILNYRLPMCDNGKTCPLPFIVYPNCD